MESHRAPACVCPPRHSLEKAWRVNESKTKWANCHVPFEKQRILAFCALLYRRWCQCTVCRVASRFEINCYFTGDTFTFTTREICLARLEILGPLSFVISCGACSSNGSDCHEHISKFSYCNLRHQKNMLRALKLQNSTFLPRYRRF